MVETSVKRLEVNEEEEEMLKRPFQNENYMFK